MKADKIYSSSGRQMDIPSLLLCKMCRTGVTCIFTCSTHLYTIAVKGCSFVYLRNCIFCPLSLSVMFIVTIALGEDEWREWLSFSGLQTLKKVTESPFQGSSILLSLTWCTRKPTVYLHHHASRYLQAEVNFYFLVFYIFLPCLCTTLFGPMYVSLTIKSRRRRRRRIPFFRLPFLRKSSAYYLSPNNYHGISSNLYLWRFHKTMPWIVIIHSIWLS